jgi:hypothetical protein
LSGYSAGFAFAAFLPIQTKQTIIINFRPDLKYGGNEIRMAARLSNAFALFD